MQFFRRVAMGPTHAFKRQAQSGTEVCAAGTERV
jgi:hypothetical protein